MPVCSDKRGITGAETTKEMLKFFLFCFYSISIFVCSFFFMNIFVLCLYIYITFRGQYDFRVLCCFRRKAGVIVQFRLLEKKNETDGRTRDIVLSIARRFVSDRKSQANWETEALH